MAQRVDSFDAGTLRLSSGEGRSIDLEVPVEATARSIVMIEQLAGLAYLAIVVSRLVALTVHRPEKAE